MAASFNSPMDSADDPPINQAVHRCIRFNAIKQRFGEFSIRLEGRGTIYVLFQVIFIGNAAPAYINIQMNKS